MLSVFYFLLTEPGPDSPISKEKNYFCRMKYQVGDEILVLKTNEEGRILEILDQEMVIVDVRGVKFPIYIDQIDFPYFKRFSQKPVVPVVKEEKKYIDQIPVEKKPQTNLIKAEDGVWLAFLPKYSLDEFGDDIVDYFRVYLVNHTRDALQFYYQQEASGKVAFELKSEILAQKDVYVHDLEFSALNDNTQFFVEFSLSVPDGKRADFFETSLKLRPKQVFNKVEELKDKNEPMFSYSLLTHYPKKEKKETAMDLSSLSKAGYKVMSASKFKETLPPPRSVVDLHIEKIIDNPKGLDSFEILQIQLREFEKWYDIALLNHQPNLIIIHGIGKGTLKEEIHQLLKSRREVKNFINQFDHRFGFGATEIFFQY